MASCYLVNPDGIQNLGFILISFVLPIVLYADWHTDRRLDFPTCKTGFNRIYIFGIWAPSVRIAVSMKTPMMLFNLDCLHKLLKLKRLEPFSRKYLPFFLRFSSHCNVSHFLELNVHIHRPMTDEPANADYGSNAANRSWVSYPQAEGRDSRHHVVFFRRGFRTCSKSVKSWRCTFFTLTVLPRMYCIYKKVESKVTLRWKL